VQPPPSTRGKEKKKKNFSELMDVNFQIARAQYPVEWIKTEPHSDLLL
jgi:hypothetical protein